MSAVKKIIYFGKDDEFFSKIESFAGKFIKSNFSLGMSEYALGEMVETLSQEGANIVYFDFTSYSQLSDVLTETTFIKRIESFRPTLFCGIVGDGLKEAEMHLLFSSGFQFAYVKGTEEENFILDSFYIGLGEKLPIPSFARAFKINKELELGICSSLLSISENKFVIETDYSLETNKLPMMLPLFKDLKAESFKVKRHIGKSIFYPFTDTYFLELPFAGPWDEITDQTIQKETVETWLDNHSEELIKRDTFVKVVTFNKKNYKDLFEKSLSLDLMIDLLESYDPDFYTNEFDYKKNALIFIDLNEDPKCLDFVGELVRDVKKTRDIHAPIIVLFNHTSTADALKKAYGYDNIVCVPSSLDVEVINLFCRKFSEKKPNGLDLGFQFSSSDPNRILDVHQKVVVTSLSEHEMTFVSKVELPYYCVLHLKLPVECYLTVVPSPYPLEHSPQGKHYLGFVHCISEQAKQQLRKFVNQIIFKPLESFSAEEIKARFEMKTKETPKTQNEEQTNIESEEKKTEIYKKPETIGKSKL